MGRPPDFLDGHHHVHQLPVVRDCVLDLWHRRLRPTGGWVRSCWDNPLSILARRVDPLRALAIALLGLGFGRRMRAAGVPHNRGFRGVYDFSDKLAYAELFRRFTDAPGPGTLVMCHPGEVDDALRAVDSLTGQRQVEFDFLASDDCLRSLARRGIAMVRSPLP
jgi:hypothetical protein